MGDGSYGFPNEGPRALDPGHEPRPLDRHRDEHQTEDGKEGREAARHQGSDRRKCGDADDEPEGDRGVRVPGRRMDRRERERPDRVASATGEREEAGGVGTGSLGTVDPRPSKRRSAGDPG